MALNMNDLDFNDDLAAAELVAVKGGRPFATTFTNTFGRDSTSFANANAASLPGAGVAESLAGVEALPGGWGVAVSLAVSVVTPEQEDLRRRFHAI